MTSADVFATLANEVRRELLELLVEGPRNAGALAAEFDLSRPAASEHLHILEQAGLVIATKHGRERHYRLKAEPLAAVGEWLRPFERYWRDRLSDLARIVETEQT